MQPCAENNIAQQAAAGIASAALAAAVLTAPAHAAQLQLLSMSAPQHSTVAAGSTVRPPQANSQTTAERRTSTQVAAQRQSPSAAAADLSLADLSLADLSLLHVDGLPRLDNPFQVLGFLLKHPVAALLVGGGLAIAVPRLVRAVIRFIVVPAALLLLLYVVVRNPGFVWGGVSSAVSAVSAHPITTSAVILVASSLLLSPYILVAGIAVVLVTGTKVLPGFMRPALPGPVSEALHQVDLLQGQTRSALDQLAAAVQPAPALKDGRK